MNTPTTIPKSPIVLIDVDALIDLSLWRAAAEAKRWLEFYTHIPAAKPRNPGLIDVIALAKAEGCIVGYSSRWPEIVGYLWREWLEANDFPPFLTLYRRGYDSPAALSAVHAQLATGKFGAKRPVLVIHNDPAVAAELRNGRGIAALTPEQLPKTVEGLKKVFSLARNVTPLKKASA
jgi:hypothetical protein